MTSGICFTLIQLVKGHGSTEETRSAMHQELLKLGNGYVGARYTILSSIYMFEICVCHVKVLNFCICLNIVFKKCLRLQRRDSRIVLSNCKPLVSLGTPMTGENNAQLKI